MNYLSIHQFSPETDVVILISELTRGWSSVLEVERHNLACCRCEILQAIIRSLKRTGILKYRRLKLSLSKSPRTSAPQGKRATFMFQERVIVDPLPKLNTICKSVAVVPELGTVKYTEREK